MMRNERGMLPAHQFQAARPQLDSADIVIIGNGIAGLTAAVEARRLAPEKRIVIVTDQTHPTINTPSLKQFAIGKLERDQLLAYPAGTERANRIHVVGARVEAIHAQRKYIELRGGRGFGYDKLLLATGSAPSGLSEQLPGRNFDGVCMLHRLQDYLDLRRRLSEVSDAVVIGGGVHAIETVMGLAYWGIRVHWLIRGETFMGRILDQTASEMVLERVRQANVKVYTQTEVMGIVGRIGAVAGVITNHQEMIPCQLVLTCTGTYPVTKLAEQCDTPIGQDHGIMVDDFMRTTVQDIYAAGDVAALRDPLTGKYETRALWYAAVAQGRAVAASMVGYMEQARTDFGVQWHGTHLGELSMLTVGKPLSKDKSVMALTDSAQGSYRRLAIQDDRLIGYLALGPAQPDSLAIKRIIDEGHSVREITKALLKGDFDARQYLSQKHTRTAQGMLSGKLPAVMPALPAPGTRALNAPARPQTSELQHLPATGALPAAQVTRRTDALLPAQPVRRTDALPSAQPVRAVDQRSAVVSEQRTMIGLDPAAQEASFLLEEEEVSPFTGTLPALTGKFIEARLEPASVATSTQGSPSPYPQAQQVEYSPSAPRGMEPVPARDIQQDTQTAQPRPSRSLWSYSNK